MSFIGTLSQTLTLRAAFASSTYLLSQIPGPGRSSDDDLLIPLIPFSRWHIMTSCAPELVNEKDISGDIYIDIWVEIDIGCYLYLKDVERIEQISKTRGEAFRKGYAS